MKKIFVLTALVLAISFTAQAQIKLKSTTATAHSVTLIFTGLAGSTQQVWRAPCSAPLVSGLCPTASEGTFTSLTGSTDVAAGISTYIDTTVVAMIIYSYYMISDCVQPACGNTPAGIPYNGSSVPSNHVGVAIPTNPPPPNLILGPVAVNHSGTCCVTIATSWTDSDPSTAYMLFNQNGILKSGFLKSSNSKYYLNWRGLPFQIVTASLAVCDLQGCLAVTIPPLS